MVVKKRVGVKKKVVNSFDYRMKQLEEKVSDGDLMLFEWYNLVQKDFQKGKITKKQMSDLFKEGSNYGV